MVMSDFLLNHIQAGKINNKSKENICQCLLENEVILSRDMDYQEKLIIYTTKHILNLKQDEERLLNKLQ